MSKKNKATTPSVWVGLTPPTKTIGEYTVILDLEGKVHLGARGIMDKHYPQETPVSARFNGLEEFLKQNQNTILGYHEQFIGDLPKGQEDIGTIAMIVWAYFCKNGHPHIPDHTADGEKERKSTLNGRIYTLLPDPGTGIKTPQAQACYKIFKESVKEDGTISENDLKAAVTARASELRTRQDPWRIFQYYRPTLISTKYLKHD